MPSSTRLVAVTNAFSAYKTHFARVEKDDETGCWVYSLPSSSRGRPRIDVAGHKFEAYTYFWLVHTREEIPDGMVLRHTCGGGERGCVNPAHLKIGTYQENNLDTVEDGTWANQHTKGNDD